MNALKTLPKVDKCLTHTLFEGCNATLVMKIARIKIEALRQALLNKEIESFDEEALMHEIKKAYDALFEPSLKPLINATGVILHTNMGRSLISKTLLDRASDVICNYSNLEYNLELGSRGERYEHVSTHLKELLGVEDVLVVNNNASAVFLILNTFAKNQEVVVSRGELVEIGGSFRIPEVMKQSGAILNEVGATNKTKITDYESAINENTAMLMKVHQSNFSIEGFSEAVAYEDLKQLATQNNLLDYYDLGSGYVPKLPYNLGNREHSLSEILTCNPSLISFSGDKLFGSVQAGIIAGCADLIAKLKKNQLLRMLRVDKITLSLLEESIKAYLAEEYEQIPTLWLLFRSVEELAQRALHVKESVGENACEIVESETYMGGGTLPNRRFPTIALHVKGKAMVLERKFRENYVIGRIENDHFLLDFRTILPNVEEKLSEIIKRIVGN
ncbi:L-seryl-tRNA(Sec) selenium transferase [Sulfurospirillum halorespirans]|uniref:L-seryl-tRNA(Sec) selenium transferase n=1 Tax=Sulfurospirillum halorespirans DSM 13726 TaxID=1193502 RepID=A0A1D7TN72_9BACT|nr:L-seryl-tRNA(Sec) selenium transferase [Sulfurospirillum halorespirans]AOO66449.1 L-seryl-tRNA(Sec) selenium transferase [Sulfurospirillum halorespirans DSM 13726]